MTNTNQKAPVKSKLTEVQARALLTVSGQQATNSHKKHHSNTFYLILLAAIIVIGMVASLLLAGHNTDSSSKSGSSGLGLPNQSEPTNGNDVTNQVNQDVNSCSNPVNAATVC